MLNKGLGRTRRWITFAVSLLVVVLVSSLPASAVTLNPGDLLVADYTASPTPNSVSGTLFKVNPATGAQEAIITGEQSGLLSDPTGVAVSNAGVIYLLDQEGGTVWRVDASTGATTEVSSGGFLMRATGMTIAPDGRIVVANRSNFGSPCGADCGVIMIDPVTGAQTMVSAGGNFVFPTGVAVSSAGMIYVVDIDLDGHGAVVRVDPSTGQQTVISAGGYFVNPIGITLDGTGQILVGDWDALDGFGALVRVDPVTGAQILVSSGGYFVNPGGVAVAANGDIYVTDTGPTGNDRDGRIIRVDALTGTQQLISAGGELAEPLGIAIVPFATSTTVPSASTVILIASAAVVVLIRARRHWPASAVGSARS